MNYYKEQELEKASKEYFSTADKEIEDMYQAFKIRMMYELRVKGHSFEGVVNGYLNESNTLR